MYWIVEFFSAILTVLGKWHMDFWVLCPENRFGDAGGEGALKAFCTPPSPSRLTELLPISFLLSLSLSPPSSLPTPPPLSLSALVINILKGAQKVKPKSPLEFSWQEENPEMGVI